MSRTPRVIRSGKLQEVCLRVTRGLPFPPIAIINLLLNSAMARCQRDSKITICHLIWLGNHLHLLAVAHDGTQFKNFYMELQKKLTESIKRLTGTKRLHLWDGRPMVAEILDVEKAIERTTYLYLNAARANLTSSIAEYPGISSWNDFKSAGDIESSFTIAVPYVSQPRVPKLEKLNPSRAEDRRITERVLQSCTMQNAKYHHLTVEPNAWMKCFGITSKKDVARINSQIHERIEEVERSLERERRSKGKRVLGADRLRSQGITWKHEPKKHSRRVFVLSSCKEKRITYITMVKELVTHARFLYQEALRGVQGLRWPPGMFRPGLPLLANSVS